MAFITAAAPRQETVVNFASLAILLPLLQKLNLASIIDRHIPTGVTRLPLNFWRAQPTYAAIANGASAPYRAFCSRAIRYSWYSSQ